MGDRTVLGIIGGSGLYQMEGLARTRWERVDSPFGAPSDELLFGELAGVEEGLLAREGPIDELIGEDEVPRRKILPQRAAGRDGQNVRDTHAFQRIDVRAVVDRRGRKHVTAPMARQEHDVDAGQLAEQQLIRRRAER